ncbi:hypothetical protein SCP_0400230 [Sparassis crispa]|uniref:Uncharacterized protein n=1 Tax=Sparassis crispa TaxID=139825 RepID=A0A401GHK1_9APHY|nr:hypothetical protein SCP_0400230 [Sparassis crispa]GBE81652.1 hypothetical protein SCP_0400230 [Sparassis crispa]
MDTADREFFNKLERRYKVILESPSIQQLSTDVEGLALDDKQSTSHLGTAGSDEIKMEGETMMKNAYASLIEAHLELFPKKSHKPTLLLPLTKHISAISYIVSSH